MSNYPKAICPVTGIEVDCASHHVTNGLGDTYVHRDSEIHVSETADKVFKGYGGYPEVPKLETSEIELARQLLRSRQWRNVKKQGRPLMVTTRHHLGQIQRGEAARSNDIQKHFSIHAIEDEVEICRELGFRTRCLETLVNLYDEWKVHGKLPVIPYHQTDGMKPSAFIDAGHDAEKGMTYASSSREAPLVYRWLFDEGYLVDLRVPNKLTELALSPKAMVEVESILAGKQASLKKGFFIRRYDEEFDKFIEPIMAEVARHTGCEIKAVWEDQKNDKLDELILRRIRQASIVVVDVTGDRFNVGLELGYAMSLKKQIVLICEKSEPEKALPFDIRTLNCYFYERDKPEQFQEKLKERVIDALEEARISVAVSS